MRGGGKWNDRLAGVGPGQLGERVAKTGVTINRLQIQ